MPRGTIVASLLTLLLVTTAATASAICGQEPPISVWPHHGGLAPTNTLLAVKGSKTTSFTLVTAPMSTRPRKTVPLKTTTEPFGLLVQPDPLEPNTSYELRDDADRILSVFTTASTRDTAPPTWKGITKMLPGPKDQRGVELACRELSLHLQGLAQATDDLTSRDDIRYALWVGKTLDYQQPPIAWTTETDELRQAKIFELVFDVPLPPERPLKLGVEAIDLAGNASAPSELTVK